jgi:hypothetical protein
MYNSHIDVIETGAAKAFIIHSKTQRVYKMKLRACVGTKPEYIAGVGWNFRLK